MATIQTEVHGSTLHIATDSGNIVVGVPELPQNIINQLVLHGLKQKICDAAAIPRNPDTGRSATAAEKFAAMNTVAQRLMAGEWSAQRGDGTGGSQSLLFRALSRLYENKTADELRAYIAKLDKKQQAALRKNPRVAATIVEIQSESTSDIDTDEMLASLE